MGPKPDTDPYAPTNPDPDVVVAPEEEPADDSITMVGTGVEDEGSIDAEKPNPGGNPGG